jgi:hypothetical protein
MDLAAGRTGRRSHTAVSRPLLSQRRRAVRRPAGRAARMGARDRCAGDRGRLRRRGARAADLARFIDSGGLARHLRRVRPVCRARRDCLLAALGTHLPRIRPQGEAAGLHLLPRMPAGQDPGVISTAAETHGIMLEKRRGTGPIRTRHRRPCSSATARSARMTSPAESNRSAFQLSRDPSAREVITPLWRAARRPGYRGPGTGIAR